MKEREREREREKRGRIVTLADVSRCLVAGGRKCGAKKAAERG